MLIHETFSSAYIIFLLCEELHCVRFLVSPAFQKVGKMSGAINSVISNRDRDCLMCRIISGCGLMGCGVYVNHHSKKFPKSVGKFAMHTVATALVLLGSARILDLPPFQRQLTNE